MAAGAFVSARLRRAETAAPPLGRGDPPPWETRRQGPRGRALERGRISPARPRRPFPGGSCSSQPNGGGGGRAQRAQGREPEAPALGMAGRRPAIRRPPRTPLRLPSRGCVKRPSKTQRRASAKCLPALPYTPANAPVFPSYFLFGFLFMFSSRIKSSNKDVSVGVNISHFPS